MLKNIAVVLSANVTSFAGEMRAAGMSVRQFGAEATDVATRTDAASRRTLDTVGKLAFGLGAGVAVGFALSVKAAADFEREMRNVATISAHTRGNFQEVSDQLIRMSRELPQSASTLAKGLYDIASSGFDGAEAMTVLRASAMAASAGLTTTDVAAKGVTAVLNAYGLSGFEASRISDILFQTVNKGVVTFEELSGSLGDFVGSAAAAGVPIEDASSALATMTLSGISAAEASTSLNRVLQSLIDPSEAMTTHLKGLGYESGMAAVNALGLQGTMELLRTSTGGNIETLVKLFPEIRAARGALALMANEGRNYADVAGSISNENERLGATQRAYNEQSKTFSFQVELAKNNLSALGIEIGHRVLPILTSLMSTVSGLMESFSNLPGPVQTALTVLAGLVGTAGLLGGAFLLLAPRIASARDLVSDLAVKSPTLAAGLGRIGMALGVVGVAMTVGVGVMALLGAEKARLKRDTDTLVEALEAEQEGMTGSTEAALIKIMVDRRLLDGAKNLGVSLDLVAQAARGDERAMAELGRQMGDTEVRASSLGAGLGGLSSASGQSAGINRVFVASVGEVASALDAAKGKVKAKQEALGILNPALAETQAKMAQVEQILGPVGDALGTNAEAVKELDDIQKAYNDSMKEFTDGASVYKSVLDEKQEKEREARDTLDRTTEEGKAAWESFQISTDISLNEYNAGLERQIAATEEWSANYVAIYKTFGPQVATILADMGEEGRIIAAKMTADLEGEGKRTAELLPTLYGKAAVDSTTALFAELNPVPAKLATLSQEAVASVNANLAPLIRDMTNIGEQATAGLNAALAPIITNTTEQSRQAADGARVHLDPLPAWAQDIGTRTTGNLFSGLAPMPTNTDAQAAQTSAGAHAHLDPLPASAGDIGARITGNLFSSLDPMAPGTAQRAQSTAQGIYDPLGPVPGWTGGTGGAATDQWLSQLSRAIGETFSRAKAWGTDLLRVLNPLLTGVGADPVGGGDWADGGLLQFARGGVVEDHRAQIARGGWPVRVWAEPETEWEAYIPGAPAKRGRSKEILEEVARRFGMGVIDLQGGSLGDYRPKLTREWGGVDDYGFPHPPTYDESGHMVGRTAREDSYFTFRAILEWEKARREAAAAAAAVGGGAPYTGGAIGSGWQQITGYLDSVGQPYTITSTQRYGGGGSYHDVGKAVDMVGDMAAIFNTLAAGNPVPGINELFYDPMGYFFDNGARAAGAIGGHDDHVHAATFDKGGWLAPGYTLAWNGTNRPERVLSFADGGMGQWYGGPGYGFVGPQGELPGPWFTKGATIGSPRRGWIDILAALLTGGRYPGRAESAALAPRPSGGGGVNNSVSVSAPMTVELHVPVGADTDQLSRIVRTEVGWVMAQWQQNLQQQLRVRIRT